MAQLVQQREQTDSDYRQSYRADEKRQRKDHQRIFGGIGQNSKTEQEQQAGRKAEDLPGEADQQRTDPDQHGDDCTDRQGQQSQNSFHFISSLLCSS